MRATGQFQMKEVTGINDFVEQKKNAIMTPRH
jgi:hypothetical protein